MDERFKKILNDPRFQRIKKRRKKVQIDERFQSMFTSNEFRSRTNVDKYGRPIMSSSAADLAEFYNLNSNSVRSKLKDLSVDYLRGEAAIVSESSSDDSGPTDDESDCESETDDWNVFNTNAETTEVITNRLALCNMDWDNVRAADLMLLFNSFKNSAGCINSIRIYPSQFGLERMKLENEQGPIELVSQNDRKSGAEYNKEQLRKYELNKLKYYYAIIECDSAETANSIYTQCDGQEYESSGILIDLRFVDDSEIFDHKPKEAIEELPDESKYRPLCFTNSALKQSNVKLTWDETDPYRKEFMSKAKYEEFDDNDLKNYLASPSDTDNEQCDSDQEQLDPIEKYKKLVKEMEENTTNNSDECDDNDNNDFDEFISENNTKKTKSKKRKQIDSDNEGNDAQLELLMMDDVPKTDKNKKHYSLKKLLVDDNETELKSKSKKKRKKNKEISNEDTCEIDVNDERFSAVFTDRLYGIDPSDPNFKKTKTMNRFIDEKIKRISHQ